MTRNPEVNGSSVRLVPRNALAVTDESWLLARLGSGLPHEIRVREFVPSWIVSVLKHLSHKNPLRLLSRNYLVYLLILKR